MIESLRSKLRRRDCGDVAPGAAFVSRQGLSRPLDTQPHLLNSIGGVTSLILKLCREGISPEELISRAADAHLRTGAAQRSFDYYKLIPIVAEECPIEIL